MCVLTPTLNNASLLENLMLFNNNIAYIVDFVSKSVQFRQSLNENKVRYSPYKQSVDLPTERGLITHYVTFNENTYV